MKHMMMRAVAKATPPIAAMMSQGLRQSANCFLQTGVGSIWGWSRVLVLSNSALHCESSLRLQLGTLLIPMAMKIAESSSIMDTMPHSILLRFVPHPM
jgi:hypothetical protein